MKAKYLCKVAPVCFADIELSACWATRRLQNIMGPQPVVVTLEVEEMRHGMTLALRHLLAWKHCAQADAAFDVHGGSR